MTRRARSVATAAALLGALACAGPSADVHGVGLARDERITRVIVEPLDGSDTRAELADDESLRVARALFGDVAWHRNDDDAPLVPHYRVTLRADDGVEHRYLVGTFSDPPRPPCFALCTGYWAAPANADGTPRRDVVRALATSGDLFAMARLLEAPRRSARSAGWREESGLSCVEGARAFLVDTAPVSAARYDACVAAGICVARAIAQPADVARAVGMHAHDAEVFCASLAMTLVTPTQEDALRRAGIDMPEVVVREAVDADVVTAGFRCAQDAGRPCLE